LNIKVKKSLKLSFWICIAFTVLSILILFYSFYLSIFVYENLRAEYFLKYHIIFSLSSTFWFCTLFINQKIRLNITIISLSFLSTLYLLEGLITIALAQIEREEIIRKQKEGFDTRSRLEIYEQLRSEYPNIALAYYPTSIINQYTEDSLFPLSGISNTRTIYSNESGKYYINFTDRYGFNNPDSEWDKDIEWLLVGDSFTEGGIVEKEQNISAQIREITGSSSISLGRGGNGPLIELASLKEYGEMLTPKKVLWIYYEGNDLANLREEKSVKTLMNYLEDDFSQNLTNKQVDIDKFIMEKFKTTKSLPRTASNLIRLTKIRTLIGIDRAQSDFQIDPLFKTIMEKARNRVIKNNGKIYFVYLPEFSRYTSNISSDNYRNKHEVIDLIRSLDIPVIDIHEELFSKYEDPLSFFPFSKKGHYTARTDKKIAEIIVSRIGS